MAVDLTCVALDTAAEITELSLDLDHAARLMRVNDIGVDEARHLENLAARLRGVRGELHALSRPLSALKPIPVTVVRER